MSPLKLLLVLVLLSSCSTGFEIHRHNEHRTGVPQYGANDTVRNWRNGQVYVIDRPEWMRSKKQVFYTARTLGGTPVDWLPENSIEKK